SRTIGARNGHHQGAAGHGNRFVGTIVHPFAAVAEILVGGIDEHHVLHGAAVARYAVVVNAVAAQELASLSIQVVLVEPSLFGFGIVFTTLGVHVFAIVALDVGRAVEVRHFGARVIAHRIGVDGHIGRAHNDIVAEIRVFRIVEVIGIL